MMIHISFKRVIATSFLALGAVCVPALADSASPQTLTAEQSAFFETKVRAVLATNCYKCHSVEQGKAKGGLTLDSRDGWAKGGDTGPAITPGDPEKSLLIKAVTGADPDLQMPPKGEKLTAAQIADLSTWIKMGAPDPRIVTTTGAKLSGLTDKARAHWSYQPIKPPAVPAVTNKAWVATPVDAFILAKLEANKMVPNRPAPREVLLRRATYDLIGLPPTPEELKAFENDRSPKAFEKVVDRLLASPHYGERWGRFWLDSARYADTTGNSDGKNDDYRYVNAWSYRDWVINAFNADEPYDQFLKEQIAADLLPGADKNPNSLAALGFLTVGKRFQNINDTYDERIDTLSKATLGMTVSCARCHDHKFDPIPTADYYSLRGVFASITEPAEKPLVGKQPTSAEVADFVGKRRQIEDQDRKIYFDYVEERSDDFRKKAAGYILSSLYSGGRFKNPTAKLAAIKEFDLDAGSNGQKLNNPKVNKKGDAVFTPIVWFAELTKDQFVSENVKDILKQISDAGSSGDINPLVAGAFKHVSADSLTNMHDVAMVYGKLFASIDSEAKDFIRTQREATTMANPSIDEHLLQLIELPIPVAPAPAVTTEYLKSIINTLELGEGAYNTFLFAALNDLELTHPGAPQRAMVVADADKPVESPVFIRGDAQQKGRVVPHHFLEILSGGNPKPFSGISGRLDLAEDIASKNNPLTARVMINRIWLHHFGEGFVRTPDDLGVQSEPPSNQELIDYLATEFMANGWSVKKIHKLIMLSNTYQESSETNPFYTQKDPENRMLWRANLRRLEFEAIRDSLLQFSGHLDPTIGGHPVNLTDEPYSFRRTVYGYVDRGNVPELLQQFDFGDPNRPNSRRTSTIVPQQALFFMNSAMSADVAEKVCSRPEFIKATDDYARVYAIYEVLYQRKPRGAEVGLAAAFYNAHAGMPREIARPVSSVRSTGSTSSKGDANTMKGGSDKRAIQNTGTLVVRRPLTIWEEYAQALLMTNEIVYVH